MPKQISPFGASAGFEKWGASFESVGNMICKGDLAVRSN